jgi:HAE1 family hydrophobic/amphiphilic exporter-1
VCKTITKLENDYKDNAVKLNVANDSTIFTLEAADPVIHDLLIAVFCCLCHVVFLQVSET